MSTDRTWKSLGASKSPILHLIPKACADENGYKINPHLLRHSFAQHTLEAAPSQINAIMKHLGHRSADTFIKTYINQSLSVQHLPKLRTDWRRSPAT